ncbi:YybH family protein [Jiangella alba]|uniref:Ketosteroid isomerase homolog n=1 Tax=Jiangella alba TaxID=561176 RepID=A0A1H5JMR5_9ACTN|nr:nuclear transport factor 2 family protein [Jiangella alba]SEE53772.1 Ketosteroid isomerase homolog [Jiangella alba]
MTTAHDTSPFTRHVDRWVRLFNAGDAAALDRLYEDDGLLVPVPGHPATGPGRLAANGHLIGLGATMTASLRHAYATGDLALIVVDWSVTATGLALSGVATDVLRRGDDGAWRLVIDNPSGTS